MALPKLFGWKGVPDKALGWFPLGFVEENMYKHTHTHARMHARTHTHTHTHSFLDVKA